MIALGIDVGGTNTKFFIVNERGVILEQKNIKTDFSKGARAFLKHLSAVILEYKNKYGRFSVGIGLPGDTDNKNGVLRFAPNLKYKGKSARNVPVAKIIKEFTSITPVVGNDVTMAAWGVYKLAAGSKGKNKIIISLGTGVGGGLILDGCLYQGAHGAAGEIGHMQIDLSPAAPKCGCGKRGCLEAFAGAAAVKREAELEIKKHPHTLLAGMVRAAGRFDIDIVSKAAARGCQSAKRVWAYVGRHLGAGVANAGLLLDFDEVILTGGVSGAYKFFKPELEKELKTQPLKTPFKNLKITAAPGAHFGGAGAALYSMNEKVNN